MYVNKYIEYIYILYSWDPPPTYYISDMITRVECPPKSLS